MSAARERPRNLLVASSAWGFLVCAAVATGCGLLIHYGSGSGVASLDATTARALGPISLDPEMNPLRAVFHAAYVPAGSTRLRYEIELVDAAGIRLWERHGALASKDDDAPLVKTTTSLEDFDLAHPGAYYVRVRMAGGSGDDMRAATLELRRNVARVDPRVPWGFGLAAFACLIVNLVASRRQSWPYRPAEEERRQAA